MYFIKIGYYNWIEVFVIYIIIKIWCKGGICNKYYKLWLNKVFGIYISFFWFVDIGYRVSCG